MFYQGMVVVGAVGLLACGVIALYRQRQQKTLARPAIAVFHRRGDFYADNFHRWN